MGALVLLLLGGAVLVVAASKSGPPAATLDTSGLDLSALGGVRSVSGPAMPSIETPPPVQVGSGFGYTPPPALPIRPTVSAPPSSGGGATPLAVVTATSTQVLKSALASPFGTLQTVQVSKAPPSGGGGTGGATGINRNTYQK